MDFHCDGKVNYSEFLAATISTINFNKEEKLWSAFKYFDTTDSGYITLDSVMDALKDSGVIIDEEGLKKTFNELQKKGKKINFNEFKAIAIGNDIIEEEHEYTKDIKDSEQNDKNKINLKLNFKYNNKEDEGEKNIKKIETVFVGEEKKESQDIFFEKVNFSTNNINNGFAENKENKSFKENNENKNKKENKENNANSSNKKENKENINNKNENKNENNKNENNDNNNNTNNNININNKANSKSNNKSNSKSNSKSNNKSSKSHNKSSKSYNKSSKSNNKSNKSNVDVLIEEHTIDNNDRFTEVNDNQD